MDVSDTGLADPDQVKLALAAEILEGAELLGEHVAGSIGCHETEVYEVHPLHPRRPEVVLDTGAQLGRTPGRGPRPLGVWPAAELADELQIVRIGIQGVADQVVYDVRAVVLRGIDVVDAELDGATEHGAGGVRVARRSEHAGTGELHRAEADAVDGLIAQE